MNLRNNSKGGKGGTIIPYLRVEHCRMQGGTPPCYHLEEDTTDIHPYLSGWKGWNGLGGVVLYFSNIRNPLGIAFHPFHPYYFSNRDSKNIKFRGQGGTPPSKQEHSTLEINGGVRNA